MITNRLKKLFCKLFPDREERVADIDADKFVCLNKEPDEVYVGWNPVIKKWGVWCDYSDGDRRIHVPVCIYDDVDNDDYNKERGYELVKLIKEKL